MIWRYLFFFTLIVLIEIYFLQGVKTFARDFSQRNRNIFVYTAYVLFGINLLMGIVGFFYPPPMWNGFFRFISSMFLVMVVCKLLGCSFLIIDDVIRLFRWLFKVIFKVGTAARGE